MTLEEQIKAQEEALYEAMYFVNKKHILIYDKSEYLGKFVFDKGDMSYYFKPSFWVSLRNHKGKQLRIIVNKLIELNYKGN